MGKRVIKKSRSTSTSRSKVRSAVKKAGVARKKMFSSKKKKK